MKLIVGLGNPGNYAGTRHNIGRELVEYAAQSQKVSFKKEKTLKSFVAEGLGVFFAYPDSFMNVSGDPVSRLVTHYQIQPEKDLLVVVDDVALPFGKFRLREKGSDGGHNGLTSVQQALNTVNYPRLRIGVGPKEPASKILLEEYVLESFLPAEKKEIPALLSRGLQALNLWLTEPAAKAMNAVNAWDEST